MFYFMDLVSTPAIKKMLISRKEQTLDLTYIIHMHVPLKHTLDTHSVPDLSVGSIG
jgi:hypothetical protein